MSAKLKEYHQKRDFAITSEPYNSKQHSKDKLIFVIQKHAASHLHYDLRLELHGVLKSWAVPKEPTLDPKIKRLAIMVEDHPYDYKDFAGIIPAGQYGAGTVEIWDKGFYIPINDKKKEISQKQFQANLDKGEIKFVFFGERLQGEFALIRLKDQPKQWLLIKKSNEFSHTNLLEEKKNDSGIYKKASKNKIEKAITPMLATLVDKPFNDPNWLFELKWDGYRAIAHLNKSKVEIFSRSFQKFNDKFPIIAASLKKLQLEAVLDGEIVAVDSNGKPVFQYLQNYQLTEKYLIYYVFDLISYKGHDLRDLPLIERKTILQQIIPTTDPHIRYSDHVEEKGISFFKQLAKQKLEGMIAKKKDSKYYSKRTRLWLKIKTQMRQEAIICGFTAPRGARKYFGALVLGVYRNKKLHYIGHTGTGFNQKQLKELYEHLIPHIQKISPFKEKVVTNSPVTWLKPTIVCEIAFSEWTEDHHMRHPVFVGLREDKPAEKIIEEIPEHVED